MLRVSGARGLHARALRQLVARSHVTAAARGPTLSAGCVRGHEVCAAGGRSLLTLNRQVQFSLPSTRCLSTSPNSEDGDLIYQGTLGTAVRGVKLFSYSTSAASLVLMPQILFKTGIGVSSLALQVAFCGMVGFFTFLTPLLLHLITKGYVLRLYHRPDSDTYTAVTYSPFLTERRLVFRQQDVHVPPVAKMLTSFYAGRTGLLVSADLFAVPHDYNHLMGYDKPFSFHADDVERPES